MVVQHRRAMHIRPSRFLRHVAHPALHKGKATGCPDTAGSAMSGRQAITAFDGRASGLGEWGAPVMSAVRK